MKQTVCILLVLFFSFSTAAAESLWDPDNAGLYSGAGRINEGQLVKVQIDESVSFSFEGSVSTNSKISLEFTGGQGSGLFSFLPEGVSSSDISVSEDEELSLNALLSVRVVSFDESGLAFLQGSKRLTIKGRSESLSIQGYCNPADIDEDYTVHFNNLADATLVYTSLLESEESTIEADDIVVPEPTPPADTALPDETQQPGEAAPAAEPGGESAAPETPQTSQTAEATSVEDGTTEGAPAPALSEEKERELLIRYINRFIGLVF